MRAPCVNGSLGSSAAWRATRGPTERPTGAGLPHDLAGRARRRRPQPRLHRVLPGPRHPARLTGSAPASQEPRQLYSYWTARTIDTRAARCAGQAAASIATPTPNSAASPITRQSGSTAGEPATGQGDEHRPDDEPGQAADDRADDPEHAGLDDDHPPDLRPGHPGRPQDPDLADPFVDVHRQRVHDPERGHEDRDERERVEQPEDAGQGRVDGARDPVDRVGLEGSRPPRRSKAARSPAVASGANRTANESAPVTPKPSLCVRPADQHRSRRSARGSTGRRSRRRGARRSPAAHREVELVADPEAEVVGEPRGTIGRAAGVEGVERRGPVTAHERRAGRRREGRHRRPR